MTNEKNVAWQKRRNNVYSLCMRAVFNVSGLTLAAVLMAGVGCAPSAGLLETCGAQAGESCATLLLSAPGLGAVTLDDLEVVRSGEEVHKIRVRDQVITLPTTLQIPVSGREESLTVRATYQGPSARPAKQLAAFLPTPALTQRGLTVALAPTCDEQTCVAPPARRHGAVAFDASRGRLVLFGGVREQDGEVLNDTWEWDGIRWAEVPTNNRPGVRAGHAMAFDPNLNRVVLFGGDRNLGRTGPSFLLNDTWVYEGTPAGWVNVDGKGPAPRRFAALTSGPIEIVRPPAGEERDEHGGRPNRRPLQQQAVRQGLVLFGGEGDRAQLWGDTWVFDGSAWRLAAQTDCEYATGAMATAPRCRFGAAMATVTPRNLTVMIGGLLGRTPTGSSLVDPAVWAWNGAAWSMLDELTVPAPIAPQPPLWLERWHHGLVALEQEPGVLLLGAGENDGGPMQDTYLIDLRSRRALSIPMLSRDVPTARRGGVMGYDRIRDEVLLLGGAERDTWTFCVEEGWTQRR